MKKILSFLIVLGTISMFLISINIVYGQEDVNTTDSEPKFIAIQLAQSGSISEINATAYSLELNDVSDKTILFSDRPDRIVTSVSTSDYIGNWTIGQDSFAEDTPNAVLVIDEQEGQEQDNAIIELFNPIYDINKKILKYDVTPDNATSIHLSSEFDQSTLIIDSHCSPWDPRC